MYYKSADDFMQWAEKTFTADTRNLDFTMHLIKYIKPNTPNLYNSVIELLDGENPYTLKVLKYVG